MIEGIASVSAIYVATVRGISTNEAALSNACRDEFARQLLPWPLRGLIDAASSRRASRALRSISRGWFDHLAVRTGLIDRATLTAFERGATQLVLLGAGLDARAHRLPGLSAVVVFEVDHPATQAYKRKRAANLVHPARELRYVACDFESRSFEHALESAGYDYSVPSCVIWEGVTMYLAESAIDQALATLSQLCAAGSTLVVSYVTPPLSAPRSVNARLDFLRFAAIAEPVRFISTPEAMSKRLREHGFRTRSDQQPLAEASTFGIGPLPCRVGRTARRERVLVAERDLTCAAESVSRT